MTGPEAEALFRTMTAYAGSYTMKDGQIIHHVDASWNETWTGSDQIRNYKFDGDRLSLATAPSPNPFTGKMSVRTFVCGESKVTASCVDQTPRGAPACGMAHPRCKPFRR